GRGKRPNRRHERGRPLDLRPRRGASTSEIHRIAGTAATPCPAGVIRRFTPPEPISCAGGVREAILEKDPTLRTFVRDRLAEGWAPNRSPDGSRPAMSVTC